MRFFFFLLLLSACRSDVLSLSDLQDHRHDLALAMSVKLASKKTDSEFALVRRRELPSGMNIKELALDLFEKFRIGKRNGKGVLILFVEKTKEVKIEVSYALEGILTDALCRRLENAAQTYFLSDIPQDYFSELLITMSNAVLEGQSPEEDLFPAASQFFLSGGGGLHSMIAGRNAEALLKLVRKISDESEKRYMPADIPEDSLGVYMKSLENGIGDPELPILSEGSMIFRIVVPRTRTQIRRLYSDYTRAGLDYFLKKEKEGLALAVFRQGKSVLPIWLEKNLQGKWLVDEVKSWLFFHRFEDNRDFFLLTNDNPFRDLLRKKGSRRAECTLFKDRFTTEKSGYSRGDKSLFEWGWFSKAREDYLEQLSRDPGNDSLRWKLFHVFLNLSEPQEALAQLEELYRRNGSRDRELREWRYFYRATYRELRASVEPNLILSSLLRAWNVLEGLQKQVGDIFLSPSNDPCLHK